MAIPRRSGATPARSAPSTRTVPAVGSSRPATSRSTVLLPDPDGPEDRHAGPGGHVEVEVRQRRRRPAPGTRVSPRSSSRAPGHRRPLRPSEPDDGEQRQRRQDRGQATATATAASLPVAEAADATSSGSVTSRPPPMSTVTM